jgi:hypothetical protein
MRAVQFFTRIVAFACGAVAASLAIGLFEVTHAQLAGATISLCFGAQGELRLVEPQLPCRPGERRVLVKQPDPTPKEDPQRDSRVAALARRVSELEERERRGRLIPTRVRAPFEVIDRSKQRMFAVAEHSVIVYNQAGQQVVWIPADQSGGALQVESADGKKSARLGALDKRAHLIIQEGNRDRIDIGRRADGGYGLKVLSTTGTVAAYIGQSDKGNGLAFVADKAGKRVAQSLADDSNGSGYVTVMNAQGVAVASLFSDPRGAGRLTLADASGGMRVDAGVTDEGRGVVQAGPGFYHSGVGILGLVPSYILGKPKQ